MDRPVNEVVANVASELASLAALTSTLQEQLSPRCYDGLDIEAFQNLDALTQTLTCLATFLASIQVVIPPGCLIDAGPALAEICLSALSKRLQGAPAAEFETAQTCELF